MKDSREKAVNYEQHLEIKPNSQGQNKPGLAEATADGWAGFRPGTPGFGFAAAVPKPVLVPLNPVPVPNPAQNLSFSIKLKSYALFSKSQ